MKIIFLSTMCSRRMYEKICEKRYFPLLDSSQKFFEMFVNGFKNINNVSIECISLRPLSHSTYPGLFIKEEEEKINNIHYTYIGFMNYPVAGTITAQKNIAKALKKILNTNNEKVVIIVDPLCLECAKPAIKQGKKYKIQTIGFLTDMPEFADEADKHGTIKNIMYRFYNDYTKKLLKHYDKYIFLTEQMNTYLHNKKPWMLMECIVDQSFHSENKKIENIESKIPSVMYAGKMHRQFGMDVLLKAIPLIKNECTFDIYGDGNYVENFKQLALKDKRIKLHGIVPVEQVIKAEGNSAVLINPRTSTGEFTKYSFPSKTAEYMMSGVPIVMFRLPGIPNEYEKYLMFADEENEYALADTISKVLNMQEKELLVFGSEAKLFVKNNKSNDRQAERFLHFIEEGEK